ncbi:MAG TPA: plastocyanin/azurin family copper-binding protein, partial [Arenimonas sp.]|nr:plastocyanin/azurin family copper-binding protein [Arenimonas sp.]
MKTSCMCLALFTLLLAHEARAADHQVTARSSNTFSPASLTIDVGDTVTFVNGGGIHNVVSDPGAVTQFRCANGCDSDGGNGDPSGASWSATVAFDTAGTVGYSCELHGAPGSGMFGTITVVGAPPPSFSLSTDDQYLWMVPPASNEDQQGFLRLMNNENVAADVSVWGLDAAGERSAGTISLTLAANESRQFNSQDIEAGNVDKGLSGSFGDGSGDWSV